MKATITQTDRRGEGALVEQSAFSRLECKNRIRRHNNGHDSLPNWQLDQMTAGNFKNMGCYFILYIYIYFLLGYMDVIERMAN